jgi:hypothetical protein
MVDPSFRATKATLEETRLVRTQPLTVMV